MMFQQDVVRERILGYGIAVASSQGLQGLSLGDTARDLDLPRSGLAQHFASKDALQLGVLEKAANMFIADVAEPGLGLPAGEQRIRTLFGKWLAWSRSPRLKGGCPFVRTSAEGDTVPAEVQAKLSEFLDTWSGVLRQAFDDGKSVDLRPQIDCEQLVFELYGLYLSHHFWHWSMKDPTAFPRTMKAFDRMIETAKA